MKEIVFESGLSEFTLKNAQTGATSVVYFNPTDSAFVERLFDAFNALDGKQEAYADEAEKARLSKDNKKVFNLARQRDVEMREILDGIFEKPISDEAFGAMNVYAMANGLPVWANLVLAVMDEIDTTFAREQKATDARIKKYTAKYHK